MKTVPPVVGAGAITRWHDTLSEAGAFALARRIEAVWRAHGHTVTCRIEPVVVDAENRARVWAVRSDLVGGMPTR